ncbi:hypothetical protein G7Z17_g3147 [Cylindrodendrum hubeiense]|uniref:Manganese lipoxygenase n=1 Tax=Cylindrodendrum hubeiense TaxID=595255 RepID=A0A9P5HBF1_9HYPO|nr:hypothetical protein G7Z17_g3147 [Cylindrodendrum hubeiense]
MAQLSLSLLSFLLFFSMQAASLALLDPLLKSVSNTVDAVGDGLKKVTVTVSDTVSPSYSLHDSNETLRSAGIFIKKTNFLYGPAVGGGPYFPTGPLGLAKVTADQALINLELGSQLALVSLDLVDSTLSASQYNGLKKLDDYVLLYKDQLRRSLPDGPELGALTNFTQDLFFSMERLANSPYMIKRLLPASDTLQFTVNDAIVKDVTNSTLQQLFDSGRLFYADYRAHNDLIRAARYSAACDAYFYIDSKSGANLIYTPLDSANDWLLAKIMYNVNDFFFAQTSHLASTHEVVQIAYMAAIRTMSDNHPILALLNRLMYQAFAIQPLALNRGLINSTLGPELSSFPFFEDGSVIFASLRTFMSTFVSSYYLNDAAVKADAELQAWVQEARGPAAARDFPTITSTDDLVDVLTHIFSSGGLFARPLLEGTNRTLVHMFDDQSMLSRMNDQTRTAAAKFMKDMQTFSTKYLL